MVDNAAHNLLGLELSTGWRVTKKIEKADKIIVAWGSHPVKCKPRFEEMKAFVLPLLQGKICFQMKHPSHKLNPNRPLHGQVWGYEKYKLVKFNSKIITGNV